MTQPLGSGMLTITLDEPPIINPTDTSSSATLDDLADVVGNTAFFNNLTVAGSPISGGASAIVTATTKVVSPVYDSPTNTDMQIWRGGVGTYGWKMGNNSNLQPGCLIPLADGMQTIGDVTKQVYEMYLYGRQFWAITGTPGASPAAGHLVFYCKSDKKLYYKDETGVELAVGAGVAITQAANTAMGEIENATTIAALRDALLNFIDAITFVASEPETFIEEPVNE